MKKLMLVAVAVVISATAVATAQMNEEERRGLRSRIEERYDVIPITDGVALRPKTRLRDVRLIEISEGVITVNGVAVTGRELRERVGADADAILRLSYLSPSDRQALLGPVATPETAKPREPAVEAPRVPTPPTDTSPPRTRRSRGDRVRIFGDVTVAEDEDIGGEIVAVLGSVRVNGQVRNQVVAVLGSVDLGPRAVVNGDVVAVGGRVRQDPTARVGGSVTEVALDGPGFMVNLPWLGEIRAVNLFGPFAAVPRLVGSTLRFMLLALLACVAMLIARATVERSAERLSENPFKSLLVGFATELLFLPILILVSILLAITVIGIPVAIVLVPVATLVLLLVALAGFSGVAYAVGRWVRQQFGWGSGALFLDVCLGVLVILMPVLVGRVIALAGWPASPIAFLFLSLGMLVEFIAWATGLGAVVTNALTRWRASRVAA
jgi:hypothetical protein